MAFQSSLSSSTILLIFSLFCISHAHYSPSSSSSPSPSPLDFLKTLNGAHKGVVAKGLSDLKKYLTNLGYISKTPPDLDDSFDDTLESAIKKYQEFYSLKINGVLDQETLDLLSRPRCGVPDFVTSGNVTSLNETGSFFTFLGSIWPQGKRDLSYALPPNTRKDAYVHVARSLARWSQVSPFRFHQAKEFGKADVKISFQRRDHGDGFPFDGPNGILAHSFPPTDGTMHIDGDESWITDQNPGGDFDLQSITLHELGHILGLAHSRDPKACMFASFLKKEVRDLGPDDIEGILSLYHTG